jgi:hypothetical protein
MLDKIDKTWELYRQNAPALYEEATKGTAYKEDKTKVQVDKYEYVYGAYDIKFQGKEYYPKSVYLSKPYIMSGNVSQIVLEAEEWHPTFRSNGNLIGKTKYVDGVLVNVDGRTANKDELLRRTSVEYYVTALENPGVDDWKPILPLGQAMINQEVLFFQGSIPRTKLRFAADRTKEINLYKNEYPLKFNLDWYFGKDPDGIDSNQWIVLSAHSFDSSAIYTIDYYPSGNPYLIDFAISPTTTLQTDYFIGTDKNCSIKLSKFPFINRATLKSDKDVGVINDDHNPVKITLNPGGGTNALANIITEKLGIKNPNVKDFVLNGKNGGFNTEVLSSLNPSTTIPNAPVARLLNKTLFFDNEIPTLNKYNPRDILPTFEYYHEGNKVYFTEMFKHDGPVENLEGSNGNAIIKAEYDYIVSGIRVKIILRRTSNIDTSVTPKVKSYSIKCKSLIS